MSWIAFIRHGPTEWNAEKRIQGHTDTPLSAAGRAAVAARSLPEEFESCKKFSSPLRRARQTAALLGVDEPELVPALMEMCWGEWEGFNLEGLRKDARWNMLKNESRGLDFQPPGGESPRIVQQRLGNWIKSLTGDMLPAVAFTHKGVIRAALSLATDWDMQTKPPYKLQWECAHQFSTGDTGQLLVKQLNISMQSSVSGTDVQRTPERI